VKQISPTFKKADKNLFKTRNNEDNYFLEFIDKENMMRIRNYLINSSNITGLEKNMESDLKTYNLIEITKFIDPEVIP